MVQRGAMGPLAVQRHCSTWDGSGRDSAMADSE
jgi:hypothetical protein